MQGGKPPAATAAATHVQWHAVAEAESSSSAAGFQSQAG